MKKFIILITVLSYMVTGCNNVKTGDQPVAVSKESPAPACSGRDMNKYKTYGVDQVKEMAILYQIKMWEDPFQVIQQVDMNPGILSELTCTYDSMKLISAVIDGKVSMIMEYAKEGKINYYNIEDVFGNDVLCPQPPNCDIPLFPADKRKAIKDSLSKLKK